MYSILSSKQFLAMDPAGIGAMIGVGVLVATGIGFKLYDSWKQKTQTNHLIPLLSRNETTLRIVRQHSKMNMIIPK